MSLGELFRAQVVENFDETFFRWALPLCAAREWTYSRRTDRCHRKAGPKWKSAVLAVWSISSIWYWPWPKERCRYSFYEIVTERDAESFGKDYDWDESNRDSNKNDNDLVGNVGETIQDIVEGIINLVLERAMYSAQTPAIAKDLSKKHEEKPNLIENESGEGEYKLEPNWDERSKRVKCGKYCHASFSHCLAMPQKLRSSMIGLEIFPESLEDLCSLQVLFHISWRFLRNI